MQFTTLGRTGLNVSVVGLGTGGPSRLGLANGRSVDSIVRLIEYGLDQGINLIDLGATYGTDKIVAKAIGKRRHEVVLSAKTVLGPHIWMLEGTRTASRISARLGEATSFVTSGGVIEKRLDASLRRLKTDYFDIFSLHGVTPAQYAAAFDRLLPALLRLKEKGKIRSVGITESFERDPRHTMLARAAASGSFDTIMIGLNIVNHTGSPIAAEARRSGTGVIAMYALRPFRNQASVDSLLRASGASMAELTAPLESPWHRQPGRGGHAILPPPLGSGHCPDRHRKQPSLGCKYFRRHGWPAARTAGGPTVQAFRQIKPQGRELEGKWSCMLPAGHTGKTLPDRRW